MFRTTGALSGPDGDLRCIGDSDELRRVLFGDAKPNFAGEWIVHFCTCGKECGYPFMWNARTGAVYRNFPFGEINVGPPQTGWRGLMHRANSRLLVVEGRINERAAGISYYVWDGRRFTLVRRVPSHAGSVTPANEKPA
jgi:hypothetical protein